MKRYSYVLALALALVAGLAFAGCKSVAENTDAGNTDPKTLTVTGITGVTSAHLWFILYSSQQLGRVTAGTNPAPVSATITGPLYNGAEAITGFSSSNGAWKGTGEYYIAAYEMASDGFWAFQPKYITSTPVKFENATTTVSWSQFVPR